MSVNKRYPVSYTLFAGLAGAISWSMPYLIAPFIRGFPQYAAPPFHLKRIQLTISYAIAAVIGGGLFLWGLHAIPLDPNRFSRPRLSTRIVLVTILGMAVANAFAISVGILSGYSIHGQRIMLALGTMMAGFNAYPEPFHTISTIIGAGLAVTIIMALSGVAKRSETAQRSPVSNTLRLVLKICGIALVGRLFVDLIEFSSITRYTAAGQSFLYFFLVLAAGGALFGALTWSACAKFKPA